MKSYTLFGDNLKKLREEKGLSQKELSEILNLSPSTISMYENGQREPDYNALLGISDFFCIDVSDLLNPHKNQEPDWIQTNILEIKKRIKKMRKANHYTLAEIAEMLCVSEATAQRYESKTQSGINKIPYEALEKYAKVFGCTPQYILGWDQNPKDRNVETQTDDIVEENDHRDGEKNVSLFDALKTLSKLTTSQLGLLINIAEEFAERNEAKDE